jgi:hypothetical protein
MLRVRLVLANGAPHYIYEDCRGVKYWTKESRKFSASEENNQLITGGVVLYSNSYVINVLLNFYLKFNKVPYPVKFYTSEEEGLAWLCHRQGLKNKS